MKPLPVGVIAAVVHDVLRTEQFTALADLSEAVKCRCARLKIPYDSGLVTDAIQLVERTRPVIMTPPKPRRHDHTERDNADVRPLTREEAADLWPRLVAALQRQEVTR